MTVEDIIEYAKYGELAQLNVVQQLVSTSPSEGIEAEKRLISYINLGLIELYKRFSLKTDETTIIMEEDQTIYTIATSNFNSIVGLYDEEGNTYPLNDENDKDSIMTPSYNTLQIMNPSAGGVVYVVYNASPDKLVWASDLSTITVPVPPTMTEALLHYIGYRAHNALNGEISAEGSARYKMFESSIARLEMLGSVPTDDTLVSGTKLEEKGFA